MDLSKAVIIPKLTVVQLDMNGYVLDKTGLVKKYEHDKKDVNKLFGSHERQLKSIELLKKRFPNQILYREAFNKEVANNASIVIAAGGDDHLKYVSHYVTNTPLIGLNTDPLKSRGGLLEDNIEKALVALEDNKFEIVDETRIDALINGKLYIPAMATYNLRKYPNSFANFRYRIEFKGEEDEHDITTGISAYVGNGVGDWPRGAGKYLDKFHEFKSTDKIMSWVVHEGNDYYRPEGYKLLTGLAKPGEELCITSYKDHCAIAPDAVVEHIKVVNSGDQIVFRISDKSLKKVMITE
tara:strand:- start:341 stop:1228 length:888 start_codon:yes stop_codon:yes gene_type:complete